MTQSVWPNFPICLKYTSLSSHHTYTWEDEDANNTVTCYWWMGTCANATLLLRPYNCSNEWTSLAEWKCQLPSGKRRLSLSECLTCSTHSHSNISTGHIVIPTLVLVNIKSLRKGHSQIAQSIDLLTKAHRRANCIGSCLVREKRLYSL